MRSCCHDVAVLLLNCGTVARTAGEALGRAEAGIVRVLYRAGIARLSLDLGFSARDSLDRCACRVPLRHRAAAVTHVCWKHPAACVHFAKAHTATTGFDSACVSCWRIHSATTWAQDIRSPVPTHTLVSFTRHRLGLTAPQGFCMAGAAGD